MLEELGQDYIRTARAKGLSENVVVYKHALRNALVPVLTVVGLQFGALLAGAIVRKQSSPGPALDGSPSRPSAVAITIWCRAAS